MVFVFVKKLEMDLFRFSLWLLFWTRWF